MSGCKAEAHRAFRPVELLEDYYSNMDDSKENELKFAIERVIENFKSRVIQASLDIQEFYLLTLMDDGKSTANKISKAKELASRWEVGQEPFPRKDLLSPGSNLLEISRGSVDRKGEDREVRGGIQALPMLKPQNEYRPITSYQENTHDDLLTHIIHTDTALNIQGSDNNWEYDEIILERGGSGLGFSIGNWMKPHKWFKFLEKNLFYSIRSTEIRI